MPAWEGPRERPRGAAAGWHRCDTQALCTTLLGHCHCTDRLSSQIVPRMAVWTRDSPGTLELAPAIYGMARLEAAMALAHLLPAVAPRDRFQTIVEGTNTPSLGRQECPPLNFRVLNSGLMP